MVGTLDKEKIRDAIYMAHLNGQQLNGYVRDWKIASVYADKVIAELTNPEKKLENDIDNIINYKFEE